jgi:cupredoxin-like protein
MVRLLARAAIVAFLVTGACLHANAQQSKSITLNYKNHRFQPAEVQVPANVPVQLRVKNLDSTPMEFESVSLRVEKVVTGNSEGVIRIRALAPGRYEFFDDFHPETRGALVAK